jgi:hypothetical protein
MSVLQDKEITGLSKIQSIMNNRDMVARKENILSLYEMFFAPEPSSNQSAGVGIILKTSNETINQLLKQLLRITTALGSIRLSRHKNNNRACTCSSTDISIIFDK